MLFELILALLAGYYLGIEFLWVILILSAVGWILSHPRVRHKNAKWSAALEEWGRSRLVISSVSVGIVGALFAFVVFGGAWWFWIGRTTSTARAGSVSGAKQVAPSPKSPTSGKKPSISPSAPVAGSTGSTESATQSRPEIPPDIHQQLADKKLARGWTLHKRDLAWSIYLIIDTDQLKTKIDIDRSEINIEDAELLKKVNALWEDVRRKVPPPKPLRTEIGIIKGQQMVEHISHQFTKNAEIITWNYEITHPGGGGASPPHIELKLSELSSVSRDVIDELTEMAVTKINARYIKALTQVSQD